MAEGEEVIDVPPTNAECRQILLRLRNRTEGNQEALRKFFRWLVPRWDQFRSNFNADGSMSWQCFRRFTFYEQKWEGAVRNIFDVLDDDNSGYILLKDCCHAKRWFYHGNDFADIDLAALLRKFRLHYGSLGVAWRVALDQYDRGNCSFGKFCKVCHDIGIKRNLGKIWSELTVGYTDRCIHYRDFDPCGDRLFTHFATALAIKGGGDMREGYERMCRTGVGGKGKMKVRQFVRYCESLDIDESGARALFAVLDPHRREAHRIISEYDRQLFLTFFDPGSVEGIEIYDLGPYKNVEELEATGYDESVADAETHEDNRHPFVVVKQDAYEIQVVLTKAEHKEFTRRQLNRLALAGVGRAPDAGTSAGAANLRNLDKLGNRKTDIVGCFDRGSQSPCAIDRGRAQSPDAYNEFSDLWDTFLMRGTSPSTSADTHRRISTMAKTPSTAGPSPTRSSRRVSPMRASRMQDASQTSPVVPKLNLQPVQTLEDVAREIGKVGGLESLSVLDQFKQISWHRSPVPV